MPSLRSLLVSTVLLVVMRMHGQCGVTITTFPYSEGFEGGPAWTSGGNANDWAWGTPAHPVINSAGEGVNSWCVGGLTGQFYPFDAQSWIMSPCFDLSGLMNPYIQFKIFWEVERQYDGLVLQSSLDEGITWTNVGAFGDPPDCLTQNWYNSPNITNLDLASPKHGWSGRQGVTQGSCQGGQGSGGWVTASHCLDGLGGQPSVRFRFLFGAGTTCNNYDGIAIDDVRIAEQPDPGLAIGVVCQEPAPQFSATLAQICATSIVWNFGDPASGAQNNATGSTVSHVFSGPGTYTVQVTATTPCGLAVLEQRTFQVASLQLITSPATCGGANGSVEAVVTDADGPFTYTWDLFGVQGPLVTGVAAGEYAVSVSFPSGCAVEGGVTVEGTTSALAAEVEHVDASCAGLADGSAAALITGGEAVAYDWQPQGGNAPQAAGLAAGAYTLTVTDPDGCTVELPFTIGEPAPLLIDAPAGATACAGASITLEATVQGGTAPYTLVWSPEGPTVSPVVDTPYSAQATDANGCTAGPVTTTVNVSAAPEPTLAVDVPGGCAPHCVGFIAGPPGMASYIFTTGDGGGDGSAAHCYPQAGIYDAGLTVTDAAGCSATITVPGLVQVLPTPVAGFNAPAVVIINALPLRVEDASAGAMEWLWQVEGGEVLEAGSAPLLDLPGVGCYAVQQVVRNAQGCADTARATVCVENEFSLFVPNAFSPDGDGMNEVFGVVTSVAAPRDYRLDVFDRWGRIVFGADAPAQVWSGDGVPVGIYAWRLSMRDSEGRLREAKGHVTLLR
jgi:gliding motility-associated-like protein